MKSQGSDWQAAILAKRDRPGSSSRKGRPPPRHYSYVPVPQLRSLSIPWLLAGVDGGAGGNRGKGRGAAAFPLKTQTRPRMHARCNPMVCIRYARRYPPRGKRFLHRAINVWLHFIPRFSHSSFPPSLSLSHIHKHSLSLPLFLFLFLEFNHLLLFWSL